MKNFIGWAVVAAVALMIVPDVFSSSDMRMFTGMLGSDGKVYSVVEHRYKVWLSTQQLVELVGDGIPPERYSKCAVWSGDTWTCEDLDALPTL